MIQARAIRRITIAVVVVAALAAGWSLYQGVSASIHAEYTLHAALLTVELLDDHVALHDGRWPNSWADLEELPPRQRAMFTWPSDTHKVQQYIAVDFSADLRHMARQQADEFDAVRPIGSFYSFKDKGSVEALLNTIRKHWSVEDVDASELPFNEATIQYRPMPGDIERGIKADELDPQRRQRFPDSLERR